MGCKNSVLTKSENKSQGASSKEGQTKGGNSASNRDPNNNSTSNSRGNVVDVINTDEGKDGNDRDAHQSGKGRQKGSEPSPKRRRGDTGDDGGDSAAPGDANSMGKKKKGTLRDGSMCSSPNHSFNAEFTGSFRNLSFVDEKGDCKVERAGTMRPSQFTMAAKDGAEGEGHSTQDLTNKASTTASTKESEAKRRGYIREEVNVSTHPSDNDLVLICLDCGLEIDEGTTDTICPLTGKLHS